MSVDPIIKETQINIIIDTNIPNEKEFSFTKDVLYNKTLKNTDEFSQYPYFSSYIPYPEKILKSLDYPSQVDFFFKKDEFIRILKNTDDYKKIFLESEDIRKQSELEQTKKFQSRRKKGGSSQNEDIIQNNIMIMLSLIFPTNYPVLNNISNSYDYLFTSTSNISSVHGIVPFLLSISLGIESKEPKYSYIKSPSKGICTVTEVIWLNDLYNHPEYKKIVDQYATFQKWKITEVKQLQLEIDNELKLYNKSYGKGLNALNDIFSDKNIQKKIKDRMVYKMQRSNINIKPEIEFNTFIDKLAMITKNIENVEYLRKNIKDLILLKRSYEIIATNIKDELVGIKGLNIQSLMNSIEKVELNNEIIDNYLESSSIQFESENQTNEEKKLQERIKRWSGYTKYNEFMNLLKTFKKPNNESSNIFLQEVIEDFIRGDTENEFEELMHPINSKSPDIAKFIKTGITMKSSNPIKNTIYVRMDVIAGEINDSNKNIINCMFNGDYLGNELNRLLKPNNNFWELDPNRFFFDLKSGEGNENNKLEKKKGGLSRDYKKMKCVYERRINSNVYRCKKIFTKKNHK